MFIRILNSEMELATGCTEPGAVALTAAEAGQALRKAGVDKAEEITVNASINIIKNAMSAGIPGTDYEGMDYAAAIGALGGDPVYLLEVMNHVPRETGEAAAALVKAGKVRVNVAQVPQKLYIEVIAKGGGHTGRAIVRDLHTNVVLVEQDGVATLDKRATRPAAIMEAGHGHRRRRRQRCGLPGADRVLPDRPLHLGLLHQRTRPDERPHRHHPQCREGKLRHQR